MDREIGSKIPCAKPQTTVKEATKIYTEWANHYLDRGHYKRCVHDLRTDVSDGVLLADVVEAVIGLKVPNVERRPQDEKEMVHNIESCLVFLDELGVSVQNITSKDIREGSLKAILSLFFNLSRYKQAQKENSAAAGNVPKEKPKLQRPTPNASTEMPSKLPSPFKPSRESSPASVSHIPAPTTGNALRKTTQPERNTKSGGAVGVSGTSTATPKPPQISTSNSRPTSFIPQPKGQRTLSSIRPPSVTAQASTDSSQLPVKQSPNVNRPLAGEGKNTHNSMFDKFKLFNSKDKSGAKAHLVTKRTSSSSGVSSAQSERSDSSTSLCSESKTTSSASSNSVRPALRNATKKSATSKPTVSKISNNQALKNDVKKTEPIAAPSAEKPKLQQAKKATNVRKPTSGGGTNVKNLEKESDKAPQENSVAQEKKQEANALQNGTLEDTPCHSNSPSSQSNNPIHSSKFTSIVQNDITAHQSKILTTQPANLTHPKVPPGSPCQWKNTLCQNDDRNTEHSKANPLPDNTGTAKQNASEHQNISTKVPTEKTSENPLPAPLKEQLPSQMSPPNSLLPKPTAAVKGTSKPSKAPQCNNQDVYVPVHINPEIQPDGKVTKSGPRNDVSVAMVSPILNSTTNDNLKLETAFDNVDKVISTTNKPQESYSEEADDIVVNIKPMPPIIRSSGYGYMRSLAPLTNRLRLQTELNGGRIGYNRQILADTNRIYNMKKSLVGGGSLLESDYISDVESVDIASGYMSDGDILRPGAVCHLDDIASGYLSEGGTQSFYVHRNTNSSREPSINTAHRHTNVYQPEKQRQYSHNSSSSKFGFEDSSSLSSGISDTVAEFSTDDITSSSMSSDNNQFSNLKHATHAATCKLSLPSSSDKHQSGTKSHTSVSDGSKSKPSIKKTDSSMQTESSAFHHTALPASLRKHQHEQLNKSDGKSEAEKLKADGDCSKVKEKKGSSSASSTSKKSGTSSDSHKSRHKSSKQDDGKQKTINEVECLTEKPPRSSRNPPNSEPPHKNDLKKALPSRSATPNANYSVSKRSNTVHPTSPCGNVKLTGSGKLSVGTTNSKKILEKPCDSTKPCEMTEVTMDASHLMLQRCGTVPGCASSRTALDMKGKLKVCANTQTTMHDLCASTHSDSEYSSLGRKFSPKHYLLASPISLRERAYSNRLMPNGNPNSSDYVLLSGISGSHEHRPRLSIKSSESDNYLRLDLPPSSTASSHYAWLRHSPSAAMSIASAPSTRLYNQGALTEAESMESLSSTTSSVHAQIQHARANSLTHARLMMHQRELSASPRLSRSNSIRSTKSEKLYPSMLQRSDDADSAIGCSTSMSGYSANGSSSSHTSQPTSPISLTQGGTRIFPMLHVPPPISTSSNTQSHSRSSNSMSHYMGGLLSKINKDDDMHGSSLSLVSSTSSIYSSAEEKQAHEIKKLKRELEQAHEKVTTLTTQLTTNAHMVAAFEQSLSNMTTRLQHLTATAEQKDSELMELRTTIEALKKQSAEAGLTKMALQSMQAVQRTLQDQRISRQLSSESMSNANALSNTPSIRVMEANAIKKKKKKSWFKSSFSRAFSRSKKNKNGSVSDVEDMHQFQSDSSTPNSPLLGMSNHLGAGNFAQTMKLSHSSSAIYDKEDEATPEAVTDLKKQLREKDMVLTDIRLDALTSAHRLESLKETVNKMKIEMMNLKQDNDRLQQIASSKSLASSQGSLLDSHSETVEKRLSASECIEGSIADLQSAEGAYPDGKKITVSVFLGGHGDYEKYINHPKETFIGSMFVSNKTKWDLLDNMVKKTFKEYLFRIDPISSLGLSTESIHSYHIGDIIRSKDSDLPELLPCGYFVGDNAQIQIALRGTKQNAIDALTFEILIPKLIVHRYVSLLTDHHRIILCGPSGTGKTYIAQKLAEYLVLKSGKELTAGAIATFSVDHKSAKELRQYLSNIAEQCESSNPGDLPSVIILDNLHHVGSLAEVFNGFLSAKYQKCPYIIGTMNQATCSTTNLQLHHNFRWVLCANHMEPVKGLLGRYLRKKFIEEEIQRGKSNQDLNKVIDWMPKVWQHLNKFLETHSSSDVTIGPRLFLSCPMDVENSQVWFTDLWNYSIIPYLLEAVREGLQLYGRRAPWEDPVDWVHTSYPWPAPTVGEWPQLLRLRPEDVGYDGHPGPGLGAKHIHSNPNEVEGDPLLNMLMRLQEAATYSSPLSNDNECPRLDNKIHTEELISGGLESTL